MDEVFIVHNKDTTSIGIWASDTVKLGSSYPLSAIAVRDRNKRGDMVADVHRFTVGGCARRPDFSSVLIARPYRRKKATSVFKCLFFPCREISRKHQDEADDADETGESNGEDSDAADDENGESEVNSIVHTQTTVKFENATGQIDCDVEDTQTEALSHAAGFASGHDSQLNSLGEKGDIIFDDLSIDCIGMLPPNAVVCRSVVESMLLKSISPLTASQRTAD